MSLTSIPGANYNLKETRNTADKKAKEMRRSKSDPSGLESSKTSLSRKSSLSKTSIPTDDGPSEPMSFPRQNNVHHWTSESSKLPLTTILKPTNRIDRHTSDNTDTELYGWSNSQTDLNSRVNATESPVGYAGYSQHPPRDTVPGNRPRSHLDLPGPHPIGLEASSLNESTRKEYKPDKQLSERERFLSCRPKPNPTNRREIHQQTIYDQEFPELSRSKSESHDTVKEQVTVISTVKGDEFTRKILYKNDEINKKALFDLCKKYGRTSPEVTDACQYISMHILACSKSIKEVWPMYIPVDPNNIVFVAFCEPGLDRYTVMPQNMRGFDIVYRTIGEYRNKDNDMPTELKLFSETEQNDQKNLTVIVRKTSSQLMKKHSNLNIMTASPFRSKYIGWKLEPCIVFYVRVKGYIPIQEEQLPRELGSYSTDVREGSFTLYSDPDTYTQHLKLGCSIGEDMYNSHFGGSWGTLGAFVDLGRRSVGCITSAHVLLDETQLFECKDKTKNDNPNAESTIYQPAPTLVPINNKQPFGRVTSVVYKTGGPNETGVEVGLIMITDPNRYPENGRFPKVAEGFTEENQLNYMSGTVLQALPDDIGQCSFYKYGAKTGLTRGAFTLNASAVRTDGKLNVRDKCELHNQIEVVSIGGKPFAAPGDSGSLVLIARNNDLTNLHAIGILTGGNDTLFYVTPIWEVLKALKLPLQLKMFNQHTIMDTGDENKNAVLPSEIGSIQSNIEEVKNNLEKEIKTVVQKIGNVETKVDRSNSELTANMQKLGSEMNLKVDKLSSDLKEFLSTVLKTNNNKQ